MKKYIFILAFCAFFIACDRSQAPEIPEKPEKPEVPEEPKDPEEPEDPEIFDDNWLARFQIPEDILFSLSTEELVEICLHFPSLYGACVMITYIPAIHCNDCMDKIIGKSNGLSELFKRKDCLDVFLKKYDEFISNIDGSELEFEDLVLHMELEMLISRYKSNDDDAIETYRKILRHLVDGFEAKLMFPEVFTDMQLPTNYIARMNMIENISPGTLMSKFEPSWWWDYFTFIPCYCSWHTGLEEAIVINELSYELIK